MALHRRITSLAAIFLALFFAVSPAQAEYNPYDRTDHLLAGTSIGFGIFSSETLFVTSLQGDYFIHNNWSAGAQTLFGAGDGVFVWGTQAVGKYTADLNVEGWLSSLKPFTEMLIGFALFDAAGSEFGFLGGFGVGGDYFVTNRLAVSTNMEFQFTNVGSDTFSFVWKVINLKYLF